LSFCRLCLDKIVKIDVGLFELLNNRDVNFVTALIVASLRLQAGGTIGTGNEQEKRDRESDFHLSGAQVTDSRRRDT
jgi:hypothetical protein